MRARAFFARDKVPWGVHPHDHKRPAADVATRTLPLPERLYVPLQQHIGAPARPVVMAGKKVYKGQLIAEAQGPTSAAVHAPTSGRVHAIGEITAPHPSGLAMTAIIIESDGEDEWIDSSPCRDPFALPPEEIATRIAAAGIVGLGGATFPAALKLASAHKAKIHTLILNGCECEPYLSCDDRLMRDAADEIVAGIRLMMRATGAQQALIGIEENKPEAIAAMRAATHHSPAVEVRVVPARYPMGSEKHLFSMLMGREIPADCRTTDLGALVHNVGTAHAVYQAICAGHPLVERLLTVHGAAVAHPGNLWVPIGALVSDVFAFAGLLGEPARLVMGGPMMGVQLPHMQVPVIKGTSGLLALSAEEIGSTSPSSCIRCASCVRACPVGLLPLEMAARIKAGKLTAAVDFGLKDCLACGCCTFVCPAHIPLVHYFLHAKNELAARARTELRLEATKRLAAARKERLEREAKEKAEAAARRKAERMAQKAALHRSSEEATV
ncbi:MAG: electron transport complex subunit RsxC [Rhodocyclaceae bacterium]|nr:electron transport complex subunit RsxC [Rhodocyclaceae bacterium]